MVFHHVRIFKGFNVLFLRHEIFCTRFLRSAARIDIVLLRLGAVLLSDVESAGEFRSGILLGMEGDPMSSLKMDCLGRTLRDGSPIAHPSRLYFAAPRLCCNVYSAMSVNCRAQIDS